MESSVQFICVFCGSLSDEYECPCSTYFVVHQSPQETDMEMLQAREDLMEAIQAFLKKYDHIPPKEKCMALALGSDS
ncbi:hypothetical protein Tco_1564012 [Tanacetum coccineum]